MPPPTSQGEGSDAMLVQIHQMVTDLSAKMGIILSDMEYVKRDVTEHEQVLRPMAGLPEKVADLAARVRLLEQDKWPKQAVTLLATVVVALLAVLAFFGIGVEK